MAKTALRLVDRARAACGLGEVAVGIVELGVDAAAVAAALKSAVAGWNVAPAAEVLILLRIAADAVALGQPRGAFTFASNARSGQRAGLAAPVAVLVVVVRVDAETIAAGETFVATVGYTAAKNAERPVARRHALLADELTVVPVLRVEVGPRWPPVLAYATAARGRRIREWPALLLSLLLVLRPIVILAILLVLVPLLGQTRLGLGAETQTRDGRGRRAQQGPARLFPDGLLLKRVEPVLTGHHSRLQGRTKTNQDEARAPGRQRAPPQAGEATAGVTYFGEGINLYWAVPLCLR
jgi:hypothetical protein